MGEDDFSRTMGGAFSQAENHMGVEAYQAMVEHNKATADHIKAMAEAVTKKTERLNMMTFFGMIAFVLLMIPAMVLVWKFVLRW